MTDYLEDVLPPEERYLLERHLADCSDCSRYLEQIRLTIDALGRVDVDVLPQETQDGLLALFRGYQSDR